MHINGWTFDGHGALEHYPRIQLILVILTLAILVVLHLIPSPIVDKTYLFTINEQLVSLVI